MKVIPCSAVPADACVVDASYMGAPTVSIEKLDSSQAQAAAHAVLKVRFNCSVKCSQNTCISRVFAGPYCKFVMGC